MDDVTENTELFDISSVLATMYDQDARDPWGPDPAIAKSTQSGPIWIDGYHWQPILVLFQEVTKFQIDIPKTKLFIH